MAVSDPVTVSDAAAHACWICPTAPDSCCPSADEKPGVFSTRQSMHPRKPVNVSCWQTERQVDVSPVLHAL